MLMWQKYEKYLELPNIFVIIYTNELNETADLVNES